MSAIKIVIDGQELEVAPGTTILQAARQLGIDIPTFCYDPELAPNGACRICVVEVENARALVASCVAPVAPGMVVYSESERVVRARRSILGLLIANHPLVCITCEKTGECKLQDYCYRYGVADSEYVGEVKELALDASNPFFIRDMNKCILCGICVGKCQELVGAGAIDFTGRGFQTNVGPAFEDSIETSTCVFCGLCIDSCPVGALTPRAGVGRGRPWQVKKVKAVCPYCSIGCNINLHVSNNDVVAVSPVQDSPVNRGHFCARGKFGWDYLKSDDRLTVPLIKSSGVFVPVSWEEVYDFIADQLNEIKLRYGASALMGLCSPKTSNEESYLFQKLIRSLGTNNIDSYTRHCHTRSVDAMMVAFGSAAMTNSIEELASTKAVLVIGADPAENHPVLSYRIREAVRKGASLIVADPDPIKLVEIARHYLPLKHGTAVALVNCFAQVIIAENLQDQAFIDKRAEGYTAFKESVAKYTPEFVSAITGLPADELRAAAKAYAEAESAAIVSTAGISIDDGGKDLILALANLALLTGNLGKESSGLYLPFGENNLQGSADMGALPSVLTGYQQLKEKSLRDKFTRAWKVQISAEPGLSAAELFTSGKDSAVKALYILGENPLSCDFDQGDAAAFLSGLDFLIVQDAFMTKTAALADVVLPAAAFAEKWGTYTNTERRVQLGQPAVDPPGDARPGWSILSELARCLGLAWEYRGPEEVFAEMASLTPQYGGISYERLMGGGLQWPCPTADHPGTKFLYTGRFGRGLGLLTVVEYTRVSETTADQLPVVFTECRQSCRCESESMSKRSVIGGLYK